MTLAESAANGIARVLRPPAYDNSDMPAAVGVTEHTLWSMRALQPWADEEEQHTVVRRLLHPGSWGEDNISHWDRDNAHLLHNGYGRTHNITSRQHRLHGCGKLPATAPVQLFRGTDVKCADIASNPPGSTRSLAACTEACNVRADCVAFAYVDGSGCYLKAAAALLHGEVAPNDAVIFGLKGSCFGREGAEAEESEREQGRRRMAETEKRLRRVAMATISQRWGGQGSGPPNMAVWGSETLRHSAVEATVRLVLAQLFPIQ